MYVCVCVSVCVCVRERADTLWWLTVCAFSLDNVEVPRCVTDPSCHARMEQVRPPSLSVRLYLLVWTRVFVRCAVQQGVCGRLTTRALASMGQRTDRSSPRARTPNGATFGG
jgi:hypothetical protein